MKTINKTPLLIGLPGLLITEEDEARLRAIMPRGIILFSRNYRTFSQLRDLIQHILSILGQDTIIAVDHEGGRVVRFTSGLPYLPSAQTLGNDRDPEKVRSLSRETAYALRELGITLNLAPVMDVATSSSHRSLQDRCFGSDPALVADMGTAFIEGMHDGGLQCAAKHFPGLGAGRQDTHESGTTITLNQRELEGHILPFRRAIAAGVDAVLVAHASYPAMDPGRPATLSNKIINKFLREHLGFSGLIVSDDLDMGAILANYPIEMVIPVCYKSGCDLVSVCHDTNHQLLSYQSFIDYHN